MLLTYDFKQYRSSEIPQGYDEWYGLHGNSRYYNYTLNENGILRRYGNAEKDYLTDVLVNWLKFEQT